MQHLDLQVVRKALKWSVGGERVWFCTVLTTYGSAPRAPGSLLAVNASGEWIGSLSGGCVEDDFLERVAAGGFPDPAVIVRYGEGDDPNSNIRLPSACCWPAIPASPMPAPSSARAWASR